MRPRVFALWLSPAIAGIAVACGSRTELLIPTEESLVEAGAEAGSDAAPLDASVDAVPFGDALPLFDALPPIDVTPPPPDAPNPCPDAGPGSTLVYVVTEGKQLMSFYPPTATFTTIGQLGCFGPQSGPNPFSMAVDQTGIAYVEYDDGQLFRVSTADASCAPLPFQTGQQNFPQTFGMGFSRDANGSTETLYVAGDPTQQQGVFQPSLLASIDTKTLGLSGIGIFQPYVYGPELTGTGTGDLYAFYQVAPQQNGLTAIGQIDKTSGAVVAESLLPGVVTGSGWAFGFWGGDFYIFTAPSGSSTVTRYRPSDSSLVVVAKTSEVIVGAGVSTCAPAR